MGSGRLVTVHDILDDGEHGLWGTGVWSEKEMGELKIRMGFKS